MAGMPPQGHDRRFARRSRTAGGSPREGRRGRSPRPPPAVCALLAAAAAEGGTARQAPLFRAHRPVPTRRDRDTLGALDHALMRHTTAHTPRPRHSGHRSATGAQSAPERQQTAGPSRGRGTPPVTRTQHHRLSTTDSAPQTQHAATRHTETRHADSNSAHRHAGHTDAPGGRTRHIRETQNGQGAHPVTRGTGQGRQTPHPAQAGSGTGLRRPRRTPVTVAPARVGKPPIRCQAGSGTGPRPPSDLLRAVLSGRLSARRPGARGGPYTPTDECRTSLLRPGVRHVIQLTVSLCLHPYESPALRRFFLVCHVESCGATPGRRHHA